MLSLKNRLTITIALLTGGVLVVFGMVVLPVVRSLMLAEFDYALRTKVQALTAPTTPNSQGFSLRFTEDPPAEFQPGPGAEFFEVLAADGQVVARSPSLQNMSLRRPTAATETLLFHEVELPDGRPGRAVTVKLAVSSDDPKPASPEFIVTLARDTSRLRRAVQLAAVALTIGGIVVIGVAAFLIPMAARASLAPLSDLSRQVTGLGASSLSKRLPVNGLPAELKPIVSELNALLGRLQDAFEREQRFSSNVSHELLTPVTELRALAENAAAWADDPEATARFASDVVECSREMESLLRTMLHLCRSHRGEVELQDEHVNVPELLKELKAKLRETAERRSLSLDFSIPETMFVTADLTALKSILHNLFSNAIHHSPEGTRVRCHAESGDNGSLLTFANNATGLCREDLARIWEPFWRKDQARSSRAHAGLGLAISKALAQAMGWELKASLEGDLFSVKVFIPAKKPSGHKVLVS